MEKTVVLDNIVADIERHPAMDKLKQFGDGLKRRPLSHEELAVFWASTCEFFKGIPCGILSLGLRVADDWLEEDRFGAVTRGASVLYSAVDEFGLHQLDRGIQDSHHTLFLDMVLAFGFSPSDMLERKNILPEAIDMDRLVYRFYRERSIPEGLGFHLASEITSDIDFQLCYEGFRSFPEAYGLKSENDEEGKLEFYRIHTLVEPMHGSTSRDAVLDYLNADLSLEKEVRNGVDEYMECYDRLLAAYLDALSLNEPAEQLPQTA